MIEDVVDESDDGWLGAGRRLNGREEMKADLVEECVRQVPQVVWAQEKHNYYWR